MRFIDQRIHTQQPSQCDICGCGASPNKYLRRGDVADATADGDSLFSSQRSQLCVLLQQRPEDRQAAGSTFRDRRGRQRRGEEGSGWKLTF